ncbi:MAG: hypothetical protein Q9178_001807 [Gyalolechia marmorata]
MVDAKHYYLGYHIWDIPPQELVPKGEMQKNVKYHPLLFIGDMLYLISIMSTKMAILLLYKSLFGIKRSFRYLCYGMMVVVTSYCVIFFFIEAFNCNPVQKTWHALTYTGPAKCFDNSMVQFVIGGFNIATDLIILVMPMPIILKLNTDLKRKIGLLVIFSTGIFVFASTIVREVIVVQTLHDFDQSWVTVPETVWLTIENDMGIICACLPALAPLRSTRFFSKVVPGFMSYLRSKSSYGSAKSSSSGYPSSNAPSKGMDLRQQGWSESGVELVHAPKNGAYISADDGERALTHENGTIRRETDMQVSYSSRPDASICLRRGAAQLVPIIPVKARLFLAVPNLAVMFSFALMSLFAVFATIALGISFFLLFNRLGHNIAIARATGLPYVIVPIYITSLPWLLLQPLCIPLLEKLPQSWTQGWLPFLAFGRGWNYGYQPFRTAKADTFVAVSPSRNVIHTCDPDVAAQIFRRSEFRKPLELIGLLNVFGPGLTGSEGAEGRLYRKVTAPFFNERTLQEVWRVSIESVEVLLRDLSADTLSSSWKEGRDLRSMVAGMTLHNVFAVCFGKTDDRGEKAGYRMEETVPPGHKIGFRQSILSTLDHIGIMAFMPKLILNLLHQAKLPPPAVKGNIFSFLFAGHEANANTLTITLFLLALHPSMQLQLQDTIDTHLADCAASRTNYSTHYPLFKESIVIAVINETLRLFTILPFLPKTTPKAPTSMEIKGEKHVLPPDTLVLINTSAIHRHPAHWPATTSGEPRHGYPPYPASSFNPGHWLGPRSKGGGNDDKFLHPEPGSFVPFSDGARGCLGRQFAMVELCAQLVGIFSEWSVELVVEDEKSGWEGARARAERTLSEKVVFDMTLRPGEMVPIRLVRRKGGGGFKRL